MRAQLLVFSLVAFAACGGGRDAQARDSAAGDIATTDSAGHAAAPAAGANPADTLRTSATTPTAAAVPVSPADMGDVAKATEYKLTDANFIAFLQANRKLGFLRARDPQIRAMIDQARSNPEVAKKMEQNPQVAAVLRDAGISVKDYEVAGVAIASARQYINAPQKAPPTPTLRDNAAYLAKHKDVLAQLDAWNR